MSPEEILKEIDDLSLVYKRNKQCKKFGLDWMRYLYPYRNALSVVSGAMVGTGLAQFLIHSVLTHSGSSAVPYVLVIIGGIVVFGLMMLSLRVHRYTHPVFAALVEQIDDMVAEDDRLTPTLAIASLAFMDEHN